MLQAWNSEKELMAALQIGKLEASAAINLHNSIPDVIYQHLAELCKSPAALLDSHMLSLKLPESFNDNFMLCPEDPHHGEVPQP